MVQTTRFVIYGIQRTGTTLLFSLLDSHPDILCLGELFQNTNTPCHPQLTSIPRYRSFVEASTSYRALDRVANKYNKFIQVFFRKRSRNCSHRASQFLIRKTNPALIVQQALTNRYLTFICSLDGHRAQGFKLMLGQARDNPFIINYIKNSGFRVIHITRQDILRTHISRLRARQTGQYTSSNNPKTTKIEVPIASLFTDLEALSKENQALKEAVLSLGLDYITVNYEELLQNQYHELQKILSFLAVDRTPELTTQLVKITPRDLRRVIKNYNEVAEACRNTIYEVYLELVK